MLHDCWLAGDLWDRDKKVSLFMVISFMFTVPTILNENQSLLSFMIVCNALELTRCEVRQLTDWWQYCKSGCRCIQFKMPEFFLINQKFLGLVLKKMKWNLLPTIAVQFKNKTRHNLYFLQGSFVRLNGSPWAVHSYLSHILSPLACFIKQRDGHFLNKRAQ